MSISSSENTLVSEYLSLTISTGFNMISHILVRSLFYAEKIDAHINTYFAHEL